MFRGLRCGTTTIGVVRCQRVNKIYFYAYIGVSVAFKQNSLLYRKGIIYVYRIEVCIGRLKHNYRML